jgi:hypothetical protein
LAATIHAGEPDTEGRPLPWSAVELDGAAVVLDDPEADRQAEPGAVADRLGGEEGIEDPVADFRADPTAVVGDFDPDLVVVRAGADRDRAADGTGVDGVGEQVEHDLVDLGAVAAHRGQRSEIEADAHVLFLGGSMDNVDRRFDAGIEIHVIELALVQAGEDAKVGDDALDAAQALAGAAEQARQVVEHVVEIVLVVERRQRRGEFWAGLSQQAVPLAVEHQQRPQRAEVPFEDGDVAGDVGQRIVDLMGDARDHLTETD